MIEKVIKEYSGFSIAIVGDNNSYLKKKIFDMVIDVANGDIQRYLVIEQSNIKIDDVRKIQEFLSFSVDSGKKIVVLFDAEKMLPEAENSMLKILEEPPEYALIILVTTSWNSLYPTIRSRLQKFVLNVPKDRIRELESVIQRKLYLEFPDDFEKIKNLDFEMVEDGKTSDYYYSLYVKLKEALLEKEKFLGFLGEISKIKDFEFLKLLSKISLWICEEFEVDYSVAKEISRILSSKVANYNYELTYYFILLSLKDAIKKD
ncbi:DNA polymerase III subunit gamma/tau [Thermosipho melanesiensis]|uniref:DNA polymerase III gamma/tau subunits-like protein n=2 Tax=Thermosipho melanesiensis TaxID=46541 RepID=A6LP80_THEM4|nr:hypothetical protein [Thermosipho melanesiensis]ABR31731.1 DNA polymerase III gamma/tau subunits-like protein [Thermosipho melanesiensis BI429]APT74753.1 DNA polymerase III subunit gamma/tau [Thermosipho melanesiensis]OOC35073.1 DNA polymerase III subunit gamma/tau [Thermosipho melanesiensis]OOC35109.1 DNA polymerase III subunit gamma/tau [Thermosipho melanesiensis]OOC36717.1 DNA polymerase III subunit gamma/tau [Thermosipho melanesiensis]